MAHEQNHTQRHLPIHNGLGSREAVEKDLLNLFSAGLMTIGSAGFGLPIPRGTITRSRELLDIIAREGELAPIKPIILNLAAELKRQINEHQHEADVVTHHVAAIPVIVEKHRPDAGEIRAAIETYSLSKKDAPADLKRPVRALVGQTVSRATVDGYLIEHTLGATLITDILEALFTDLIEHKDNLTALRPIFIEFHSNTQINEGISALEASVDSNRTTPLWTAVEAFELAQQIQAEDMVPENWAKLQNDKGAAIGMIAERSGDPIKLRQAMDMFAAAADIWNRDQEPLSWAETESNLGNAGWLLGLMENQPELLRTSFRRLEAAHAVYADEGFDHEAKLIHSNLERMLTMIRTERKTA